MKIALGELIKDFLSQLIEKIKERAVNRDRLASLIKVFRILALKSLPIYSTTEVAREKLS